MANTKDIDQEIQEANSLKILSDVYGEIAAIRMKRIRSSVLTNRDFLERIEVVFKDILSSYSTKLSQKVIQGKLKEGTRVTLLSHNGKTVAVLISANTGFYGEVIGKIFKRFIEDIRKNDFEVTIIGKLGRSLYLEEEPGRPYTYFDFPDYGIDSGKIYDAVKHLVPYEEIRVYFGKYQSVVTQNEATSVISAGTSISGKVRASAVDYIFEPTVEKILIFFETQIFGSLFEQTIRESQLAKFASRILAMDKATENVKNKLRELSIEKLKLMHKIENKNQLNSMIPVLNYG